MRILIDIPEVLYEGMKKPGLCGYCSDCVVINDAIANGLPLQKGHGRLIDADAFISKMQDASARHEYKKLLISDYLTVDDVFNCIIGSLQNTGITEGDAPTIIEADEGVR